MALVMCLSLCACGKSEQTKAVEEKIAAIGEVTLEKTDTIREINDEYNALDDKDKNEVENADVLRDAIYSSLVMRYSEMSKQCSVLADGVIRVWDVVGGQDFWDYFNAVLNFTDDESVQRMKAMRKYSFEIGATDDPDDWKVVVWAAGCAFDEDYKYRKPDTDEEIAAVVDIATPIGHAYDILPEMEETLHLDVTQFIKDYEEEMPEKCEFLREWSLESSSFADFALNPSGILSDYRVKLSEYESAMSRYEREMDMLK